MELGLKVGIDLCKKKHWLHITVCLHSDSNSDSNPDCQLQEWNRNPSPSPTTTRPFTMRRDWQPCIFAATRSSWVCREFTTVHLIRSTPVFSLRVCRWCNRSPGLVYGTSSWLRETRWRSMTGSQIHLPRLSCSSCRSNAVALQTEIDKFVVNCWKTRFPRQVSLTILFLINNCHFYVQ